MKCPFCAYRETKVMETRENSEDITRRRRECLKCKKRFTTYERVEQDLSVVKKDGRREKFSLEKLRRGVEKAFEKRPATKERIDKIVSDIESRIYRAAKDKDIKTSRIGEIVMDKLKKEDQVAYVRFASVYREFKDVSDFRQVLRGL